MTQLTPQNYIKLLTQLKKHITTGMRRIEFQKVNTYWNIGRSINLYLAANIDGRGQVGQFYSRLSADLDISGRTLQHCEQFFRYFPSINSKDGLSWSHYRNLLVVDSPQARKKWLKVIKKERLTSRDLRMRLIPDTRSSSSAVLSGTRGALYTYRLIKKDNTFMVDCGFANRIEAPPSRAALNNKYLYTSVKTAKGYQLKACKAIVDELYTFKAKVKRVVDGDTLIAFIDQGFGVWTQQRLRFRGIDCSELGTKAGERAKRFVEDILKNADFIVIKTYKSDKYGRYLADVFYLPARAGLPKESSVSDSKSRKTQRAQTVAREGIFLNQQLLDKGLAVLV